MVWLDLVSEVLTDLGLIASIVYTGHKLKRSTQEKSQ